MVDPPLGQPYACTFLTKLSYRGTPSEVYAVRLGGISGGCDDAHGIALDGSGNVYIAGSASTSDFPIVNSLPAPNNHLQGGSDAFVARVSATLPITQFASASAKLDITAGPPAAFDLNEAVVLGAASNGIKPLSEAITLQIGKSPSRPGLSS
jgi:hypothetical protein